MLDGAAAFLEILKLLEALCVCVSACMLQAALSSNATFERRVFVDKPAFCNLFCAA